MKKWQKIIALSDPYPNFTYEIFCYLKAVFGVISLIFGVFFLFYPSFLEIKIGPFVTGVTPVGRKIFTLISQFLGAIPGWNQILGILLLFLGLYLFSRIKLARDLMTVLKS